LIGFGIIKAQALLVLEALGKACTHAYPLYVCGLGWAL